MNQNKVIFTRYLYLKDEVEIALLTSLLNKNEDAIFWAFELYFSGFENDLFELFWKIYFEFYASINPTFEAYLTQKNNTFISSSNEEKQKIVANITNNLLIRKYTIDVFMLRQVALNFEIEIEESLETWLENKDYEQITSFVLDIAREDELQSILIRVVDYFTSKKIALKRQKILKDFKKTLYKNKRIVLLSRIMHYYYLLNNFKMGKSMYISVDMEDTIIYETILNGEVTTFRPYKILPMACMCGTNDLKYLGFFKLKREIYKDLGIKNEYDYHWEYYAYLSPVWKKRMEEFQGFLNHETKRLEFPDDDLFEEFYDQYAYEPDEQKISTKEKNIPTITFEKTCKDFYELHKNASLYVVDENYLNELEKFDF
jgi:hypothetical protein